MTHSCTSRSRTPGGERGSVLVLTTIVMLGLLLALGIAIDVSRMYMLRTELQNAADAASIAGASQLNGGVAGINNAKARALAIVNSYSVNRTAITVNGNTGVEFAVNLNAPDGNGRTYVNWQTFNGWSTAAQQAFAAKVRFVRVTTDPGSVGIIFSRSVLGTTHSEARSATAGLARGANVICDLIPLSVYDDSSDFTPGTTHTIRLDPGGSISPGNYLILSFPGCTGGNCTRDNLAGLNNQCAMVGQNLTIDTQPGVQAGPVNQGLNTRFDDYSGVAGITPTDAPPDPNVESGIDHDTYLLGLNAATRTTDNYEAPTHASAPDRRIVVMPIFTVPPGTGRDYITVTRFGKFFLQNKVPNGSGGEIQAEFIEEVTQVAQGTYDCTRTGDTQLALAVLYK